MIIRIHSILNAIGRWPLAWRLMIAFLLVVGLGYLDFVSGYEISFSIFYVIPIGLSAWIIGRRWAIAVGLLSAAVWLLADIGVGHRYSNALIPTWNAIMRMGYFLIIIVTLSELKKALHQERVLSRTDGLTGLLNSRSFLEILDRAIPASRKEEEPLTLAYVDLDNFKSVNDNYGHDTGDKLLVTVGRILAGGLGPRDSLCRMGGDEFCLLLPGRNRSLVRAILSRIRTRLRRQMKKHRWPVTLSVGAVVCVRRYPDPRELVKEADALMYTVKKNGKNGFRIRDV
jgi:diguanylate cyclase (GGDEF)-like protein